MGHHPAEPDRRHSADSAGDDRVDRSLQGEHPSEVASTQTDGSKDPELALTLLGEHHEQVHEQQDRCHHTEAADDPEDLGQVGALGLGVTEELGLDERDVPAVETRSFESPGNIPGDGSTRLGTVEDVAGVRDEHEPDRQLGLLTAAGCLAVGPEPSHGSLRDDDVGETTEADLWQHATDGHG